VGGPKPAQNDDTAAAARVGSIIKGKWNLDALLGVGGMASVYAATHRNGQRAALKILHVDFARDKRVIERFLRESYVSNKIGHPSCVRVLDDDVTDQGEPYLVMELLEGETVRDFWKRHGRRVPVVRALQIAERICDCLAACHAMNVIHRDLKPANIFITHDGTVKVLDFGVAQFRDANAERTATGTALGTPAYMSPEQAMGLVDQLDGRADLFSVGAMMHALCTGQRINQGRTEAEALIVAATTPVPSIARIAPDLPVEVIQLIDKTLAFDRRNRYADAKEMQQALHVVMAQLGGSIPAPAMQAPADAAPVDDAPPPPEEILLPENDARVTSAREVIKHVERLLPNVRQFGWEHPATDRALRTAFDSFAETLARLDQPVELAIRPYSMLAFGHTAWEPSAPWDAIPYNLFACGMRTLRIGKGLTIEELRAMLTLWMLDPGRDLPPEDDIVTAFWEKALPHVEYEVVDAFAEGDAAAREAFYDESDQLERMAKSAQKAKIDRLEAKAMAVSTDKARLGTPSQTSMLVEDVVKGVYANQLAIPADDWSERVVDAIVDGLIEAAMRREPQLVLASLRRSSCDLLVSGRIDIVAQLLTSLGERVDRRIPAKDAPKLKAALTSALFGAEPLDIALRKLAEDPTMVPVFKNVLATLPSAELPRMLNALRVPCPAPLLDAILEFAERHRTNAETEIAQVAAICPPETRARLLDLLARAQTPGSKAALAQLAQVEDPAVKMEVRLLTATNPEELRQEIGAVLDHGAPMVRMAALRTLVKHGVRSSWPAVKRVYDKPGFHELGTDERREVLRALYALSPEHGEPLLLELLKKGGVFRSDAREASRAIAAEVLGDLSRSNDATMALQEIASSRWGSSDDVRDAARSSLEKRGRR
jgi:serine/threonine protein kinase